MAFYSLIVVYVNLRTKKIGQSGRIFSLWQNRGILQGLGRSLLETFFEQRFELVFESDAVCDVKIGFNFSVDSFSVRNNKSDWGSARMRGKSGFEFWKDVWVS